MKRYNIGMKKILNNHEKLLLNFIKYAPISLIIVLLSFSLVFIDTEHTNSLANQIKNITQLYKKFHTIEAKDEVEKIYNHIENIEKNSEELLKENIEKKVNEAHKVIQRIYEKNKDKKTKEEIIELIKQALSLIRFNKGRGYYFIYEMHGKNIMHPANPSLENKDLWNYKDAKGIFLLQEMHKILQKKKETFYTWHWFKPTSKQKQYEKIGFFKRFEPYDWFIGTGEYLDDFNTSLKQDVLMFIQNINIKKSKYIFVVDYQGNTLAHINTELVGKNHLQSRDKNNYRFIREFIEIAKRGEGFITYMLPSKESKGYKKVSFIKGFNKWEWLVGYGYQDKNLQLLIEKQIDSYKLEADSRYRIIFLFTLVLGVVLLLSSVYISYLLKKKFLAYKEELQKEELAKNSQQIQAQKIYKELFENAEVSIWNEDFSYIYHFFEKLRQEKIEDLKSYLEQNSEIVFHLAQSIKVNEVNQATMKLFHATSSKRLIANIYETFGSNAMEVFKEELLAIWNKEITFRKEANFKALDGKDITAIVSFVVPQKKEEFESVPVTILDITEIKHKDNLLFQQSKMAAMGEMIGNIAHQWRQPLSIISTISSGIKFQKEYNHLSDKELYDAMDNIHDASRHLSSTIEDFRNFFNTQKEKDACSLCSMFERTLKLTSSQFHNKGIEIIKDIKDLTINTYENELIQVIINILNNARDAFMEKKMSKKYIFIEAYEKDESIVIIIKDSAGGIPQKILSRVFEPYFSTKHQSQGTGIGLYMSEEIIVKHMQGRITVDNKVFTYKEEEFKGAEFTIEIPL